MDLHLRFRAFAPDGLLLWTGDQNKTSNNHDFMSVCLDQGLLRYTFNLGSGEVILFNNYSRVDDGVWHNLRITRLKREATLRLDSWPVITASSPGNHIQLNVMNGLFLGKMSSCLSWHPLIFFILLFLCNRRTRRSSTRESSETQEWHHWLYLSHDPLSRLSRQVNCTVQSWDQHQDVYLKTREHAAPFFDKSVWSAMTFSEDQVDFRWSWKQPILCDTRSQDCASQKEAKSINPRNINPWRWMLLPCNHHLQ